MKKYTVKEAAELFGVSEERIKQQYAENAKGLQNMLHKAVSTGKKVNGYTAEQLAELHSEFLAKSK